MPEEPKLKLTEQNWEQGDDITDRCQIQGCRTPKATWWSVTMIKTENHGPIFPSLYLCDRHHEAIMQEKAVEKARRRHKKKEEGGLL